MDANSVRDREAATSALNQLVDEYRDRCLWFLRSDYYPVTLDEQLRTLDLIVRYGDLRAYMRAGEIRRWLSRESSETSVRD